MAAKRRHVTTLGAGTGQGQILRGLSRHPLSLAAVVGVTDNGGHTGVLRRKLGIPAMGDIKNCLGALAPEGRPLSTLLKHRFERGALSGTSTGNIILTALLLEEGSLAAATDNLRRAAGIRTRVHPATEADTRVCATFRDGSTIRGEWEILKRPSRSPVRRVFLDPPAPALTAVLRAVRRSDLVVFAPGSFVTGLLSVIVAEGMAGALQRTRARRVMIMNLMTQPGATDGFSARDHLDVFARHAGFLPDVVLINNRAIPSRWLSLVRKTGARPVRDDLRPVRGMRIIRTALLEPEGTDVERVNRRTGGRFRTTPHLIRHDAGRTGRALFRILGKLP